MNWTRSRTDQLLSWHQREAVCSSSSCRSVCVSFITITTSFRLSVFTSKVDWKALEGRNILEVTLDFNSLAQNNLKCWNYTFKLIFICTQNPWLHLMVETVKLKACAYTCISWQSESLFVTLPNKMKIYFLLSVVLYTITFILMFYFLYIQMASKS